MEKKKISVVLPTRNEVGNVDELSTAIIQEFEKLPQYDFEIIYIDNNSNDGTQEHLREQCRNNKKIKAIFKAINAPNSALFGILQASGDCAIKMDADFQEPVDLIPRLLEEWEKGYQVVAAVKEDRTKSIFMNFCRAGYYKLVRKISNLNTVDNFTGSGLYDRSFIEILKKQNNLEFGLRWIVAQCETSVGQVHYFQQKRRSGKSHYNFFKYVDMAIHNITAYSKIGIKLGEYAGAIIAALSFLGGIVSLVGKLISVGSYTVDITTVLVFMFFLAGVQMFFLGLTGDYILSIRDRINGTSRAIVKETLNFEEDSLACASDCSHSSGKSC